MVHKNNINFIYQMVGTQVALVGDSWIEKNGEVRLCETLFLYIIFFVWIAKFSFGFHHVFHASSWSGPPSNILQTASVQQLYCSKPLPVVNSTLDKCDSSSECKSKPFCWTTKRSSVFVNTFQPLHTVSPDVDISAARIPSASQIYSWAPIIKVMRLTVILSHSLTLVFRT